jgi:monoterpene epsilon-lactone hydrolase
MIRPATVALFLSAIVTASSSSQDQGDDLAIPSTISPEAREYLKNAPPSPPMPDSLEGWKAIQGVFEEIGRQNSQKVVKSLGTVVKETEMSGVAVHVIIPRNPDPKHQDKALIHVHGGGYCLFSAESTRDVCATVADLTRLKVYCIDYRLAPQDPFPAGLDDCVNAYEAIIKDVCPKRLGLFGLSAGGSMVIAMTLKMQDDGLPTPAAIASITPWADLTLSGETYVTNDPLDPVLDRESLKITAAAYAGKTPKNHPLVSPLFAKYSKAFPPTLIQTGTRDVLLSDCVRLHRKMKTQGVDVQLSVYEGMWHAFHVVPNTTYPEARAGFKEVAEFLNQKVK